MHVESDMWRSKVNCSLLLSNLNLAVQFRIAKFNFPPTFPAIQYKATLGVFTLSLSSPIMMPFRKYEDSYCTSLNKLIEKFFL